MSTRVMKVMVPPRAGVPRIVALVDALIAGWRARHRREDDLLRLAREVEGEQPGLACELRGIAMHEAAAAAAGATSRAASASASPRCPTPCATRAIR